MGSEWRGEGGADGMGLPGLEVRVTAGETGGLVSYGRCGFLSCSALLFCCWLAAGEMGLLY